MSSSTFVPSSDSSPATSSFLSKIATGAASIISSLINDNSSSESEYSKDDTDTEEISTADSSDNENNYPYFMCDEADRLNKEKGNKSALDECLRKESQLTIKKSETKHLIEKLIVQETFSREERDSLISIINSRVSDSSTIEEGLVVRSDVPDLCTKAIMEAKQWIEEKKEASNSKLKRAHEICNSVMLSQDNKGGLGSPVDMAKAYMRDRPPWSALSMNSAGEKTPSPMRREVLKPYGSSFSSSKRKVSSLSSGSWNIQDEIRRVRSKATEEILKTVPSQKYYLSSFALEHEGIQNTGKPVFRASAANIYQDNSVTENLQLQPVTVARTRSAEDNQMVEEDKHAANGLRDSTTQEPVLEDDLRFTGKSCPTTEGDTELRGKAIDSGFALSGAREVEKYPQPSDDRNPNAVSSSHDKLAGFDRREETCHLLSESSVDEIYDLTTDNSVSNSIKITDEPSKASTRSNLKQGMKGKTTTNLEKGQGRKLSRYNKKTKGKD